MVAQWVHLDDEVLIATGRGAWLQPAPLAGPAFLAPMPATLPAGRGATRHLLDGAIAAAERTAHPPAQPTITRSWWAWQLIGQWYSAHHSIELVRLAIGRFRAEGREDLVDFAERKLDEEQGHDELPLNDLRALGYDAEAAVQNIDPSSALVAGIEYARQTVTGPRPVEFLGYLYAVERRVIRISPDWFDRLRQVLGRDADGAVALRSHALSLDRDHVLEAVDFVSALPADDRSAVAEGAYRITRIRCTEAPAPSERQLADLMSPYLATPVGSSPSPLRPNGGRA